MGNGEKFWLNLLLTFVGIVIIVVVIFNMIVVIDAGEVGVVYDARKGLLPNTLKAGWHFKIPILQTIHHIPIARDTINMYYYSWEECQKDEDCDDIAVSVPSKEGLEIVLDVSVFYKVKPEKAVDIVQTLTTNYVYGTIIPTIRSTARDVAGGMAVTELYGVGREKLEVGIFDKMRPKFEQDGFILEEVLVRDVKIPDQIADAIKAKQTTEQEMLQKQFEVEKEKLEAQRKIAEAQGIADAKLKVAEAEAKSIEIQGKALRENPDVVQLRWVEKWDGKLPNYMFGGSATPLITVPSQITIPT